MKHTWSDVRWCVSAAKPSGPALLEVVNVTADSITLSWLSPERDGGSRILRYIVEMCDERTGKWLRMKDVDASEILVASIGGLQSDGRRYRFRVRAESRAGLGLATELREAVVPRSQLGKT